MHQGAPAALGGMAAAEQERQRVERARVALATLRYRLQRPEMARHMLPWSPPAHPRAASARDADAASARLTGQGMRSRWPGRVAIAASRGRLESRTSARHLFRRRKSECPWGAGRWAPSRLGWDES
jgi:hypothetical protein